MELLFVAYKLKWVILIFIIFGIWGAWYEHTMVKLEGKEWKTHGKKHNKTNHTNDK